MPCTLLRPAAPLLALALAACASGGAGNGAPPAAPAPASGATATVRPGAPGEATRAVDAAAVRAESPRHTAADVRFMQGMIPHHQQAVVMTALVPERTENPAVLAVARRIALSQDDEMAVMRRWLERRNGPVPAPDAHHHAAMGHGERMPGMLTQAELDALAAARGPAFDRLFLEAMIRHHEGALTMIDQLFATPGAGQEGEIYQFAAHVGSDQKLEISRMVALLR